MTIFILSPGTKQRTVQAALDKSFKAPDAGDVYAIADDMIAKLGGPG